MKISGLALLAICSVAGLGFTQSTTALRPDPPIACGSCAGWNAPMEPFQVFGNTYYVGVAGLSSVLVTSPGGHVLLDGALPQSAPAIDAHIRRLGFRSEDIGLILNSHAHFDHAGGISAFQRLSRASVAASASGARALEMGLPTDDDPQIGFGREGNRFPAVSSIRVVRDGEVLQRSGLSITAHLTPGHTPGSTTWTWTSCEGPRCLNLVYADSLNAIAAPGFRFTGDATHPSLVESFRTSIDTVANLPCDVLLTVHPGFANIAGKLAARRARPETNPFIDASACRAYAASALRTLEARVAEERQTRAQ